MLSRLLLFVCVLSLSMPAVAQQELNETQLAARAELNQGVVAFRAAHYEDAMQHFSNAVRLDPGLKVGHLYLATAYAQQFVPGVEKPENIDMANHALEQYAIVLRRDPANITAVKSIAFLQMQLRRFPEAEENYKKALELDPEDPETFYSAGVVDWMMVFQVMEVEKSRLKLDSLQKIVRSPRCNELRSKGLANIEDGMAMLTQAMTRRPDYADAMTYMNLLYRLRAGLDCGDKSMQAADMKAAENWSDLAMATRMKKAEKKRTQDGATGDNSR